MQPSMSLDLSLSSLLDAASLLMLIVCSRPQTTKRLPLLMSTYSLPLSPSLPLKEERKLWWTLPMLLLLAKPLPSLVWSLPLSLGGCGRKMFPSLWEGSGVDHVKEEFVMTVDEVWHWWGSEGFSLRKYYLLHLRVESEPQVEQEEYFHSCWRRRFWWSAWAGKAWWL